MRSAIRRVFEQAGLPELARTAYGATLDRLAAEVLRGESAVSVASIQAQIEALRLLASSQLLSEGDRVAAALWQSVMRGIFAGRTQARMLQDLALVIDRSESQIRTLYDTSVSVFGRQVEALTADPGPETVFAYVGPDDDVTRPFCEARVGKAFTRQAIERMDNGQIGNVFLTAGGYNCRHSWVELSRFSESATEAA
jgi:hypothetical protein